MDEKQICQLALDAQQLQSIIQLVGHWQQAITALVKLYPESNDEFIANHPAIMLFAQKAIYLTNGCSDGINYIKYLDDLSKCRNIINLSNCVAKVNNSFYWRFDDDDSTIS